MPVIVRAAEELPALVKGGKQHSLIRDLDEYKEVVAAFSKGKIPGNPDLKLNEWVEVVILDRTWARLEKEGFKNARRSFMIHLRQAAHKYNMDVSIRDLKDVETGKRRVCIVQGKPSPRKRRAA